MWLNNFKYIYKATKQALTNALLNNRVTTQQTDGPIKGLTGVATNSVQIDLNSYIAYSLFSLFVGPTLEGSSTDITNRNACLYRPVIGSGSTPVTLDDYDLESRYPRQGNYSMVASPGVYDATSNSIRFNITVQCLNANGITISEFGLVKSTYTTSSRALTEYLMFREVLPGPINLANGETATIAVSLPIENF